MFKQVKVDILGIVENMSYFVCPHCHHEIDIFSKGGGERTAEQFSVPFLGSIELDPDIRKGGDSGQPIVLEGDQSPHAKSHVRVHPPRDRADQGSAGVGRRKRDPNNIKQRFILRLASLTPIELKPLRKQRLPH